MDFDIRLDLPEIIAPEKPAVKMYDPDLDDVRSILRDACESLANVPEVRLAVTVGSPIPLDVRRDLVIVVEQLYGVLVGLRDDGVAVLDLYEQGVEEQVSFVVKGAKMLIERRKLLDDSKETFSCIEQPSALVTAQLRTLARTFVDAARRRSPELSAHPWFDEWARALIGAVGPEFRS